MKNGTTRLAYKPEHVVDMETGVILAAEVFKGNEHDAGTLESSLTAAEKNLVAAGAAPAFVEEYGEPWHKKPIADVVADKGYHKASVLLALHQRVYRSFIHEKKQRGRLKFTPKGGQAADDEAFVSRTVGGHGLAGFWTSLRTADG
jgi:transposase